MWAYIGNLPCDGWDLPPRNDTMVKEAYCLPA